VSILRRFMSTAREALDERDRDQVQPGAQQPPIFVRANWLFVEIDEALAECARLSVSLKDARLSENPAETYRLTTDLANKAYQIRQLCRWVEEQFAREQKP